MRQCTSLPARSSTRAFSASRAPSSTISRRARSTVARLPFQAGQKGAVSGRGAPKTPASWPPSAGRSQNAAPLPAGSHLRSEPQNAPERKPPRPSSPGPCRFRQRPSAVGFLLRRYRSARRFSEGSLLRRLQDIRVRAGQLGSIYHHLRSKEQLAAALHWRACATIRRAFSPSYTPTSARETRPAPGENSRVHNVF